MKKNIIILLLVAKAIASNAQLPGNCLKLTADGQYVEAPDASSASLNNDMTIEMWVYYTCENEDTTSKTFLITKGWCQTTWSYYFSIDSQKLNFLKQVSGCGTDIYTEYSTDDSVINYNTWTHVAVVIANTNVSFYVNGQSVTSSLTHGTPFIGFGSSAQPIRIGSYLRIDGVQVGTPKGNLDDVRIWHTARSAAQIASNFKTQLSGNEPGLYCYWKLNETGSGPGINVLNSAAATSSTFNGTTVGDILFENTNSVLPCLPSVTIGDKSILEGNTSTKQLRFLVTLSNTYTSPVSIKYKTFNNTATTGSDYIAKQGTLTFNPGETAKNISIAINGDTQVEPNESFYVRIGLPVNATIADDTAIGVIRNDDTAFKTLTANDNIIANHSSISIYPNPVRNTLFIHSKVKANFSLSDATGKVVITKQINGTGNMDISKLSAGIYFLKNEADRKIYKIIVEK